MKQKYFALTALVIPIMFIPLAYALDESQPNRIMFTNVNVFDGKSESLNMNTNVLVENNLIKSIG